MPRTWEASREAVSIKAGCVWSETDSGVYADKVRSCRTACFTILAAQSLDVRVLDSFEARYGGSHLNSK